jgi:hypothetical protein
MAHKHIIPDKAAKHQLDNGNHLNNELLMPNPALTSCHISVVRNVGEHGNKDPTSTNHASPKPVSRLKAD